MKYSHTIVNYGSREEFNELTLWKLLDNVGFIWSLCPGTKAVTIRNSAIKMLLKFPKIHSAEILFLIKLQAEDLKPY